MKKILLSFVALLSVALCSGQTTVLPKTTILPKTTVIVGTPAPTGATFLNSAKFETSGSTTAAVTGLSIPSGSIIMAGTITTFSGDIVAPVDSNSDTPGCDTAVQDGNAIGSELCVFKAGATITSVTCKRANTAQPINCLVTWYSPGSLTAAQDQAASSGSMAGVAPWTSGATAALSGSTDLAVDLWATATVPTTSTYSDSSTERIVCVTQYACALADRNVTGTTAVTGTGTWSGTRTGAAHIMAVK